MVAQAGAVVGFTAFMIADEPTVPGHQPAPGGALIVGVILVAFGTALATALWDHYANAGALLTRRSPTGGEAGQLDCEQHGLLRADGLRREGLEL